MMNKGCRIELTGITEAWVEHQESLMLDSIHNADATLSDFEYLDSEYSHFRIRFVMKNHICEINFTPGEMVLSSWRKPESRGLVPRFGKPSYFFSRGRGHLEARWLTARNGAIEPIYNESYQKVFVNGIGSIELDQNEYFKSFLADDMKIMHFLKKEKAKEILLGYGTQQVVETPTITSCSAIESELQ